MNDATLKVQQETHQRKNENIFEFFVTLMTTGNNAFICPVWNLQFMMSFQFLISVTNFTSFLLFFYL